MPNPLLSAEQLAIANTILDDIRQRLRAITGADESYHWALRRKVSKELMHDERGKPMQRRRLKAQKRVEQGGKCPECKKPLPASYCVLDRYHAIGGYTAENTRLLCRDCDAEIQRQRGYA